MAPFAATLTVPWVGSVTLAAVRVSPLSASVSLARTPGAATTRVVFLGVEYESATATGAALVAVTVRLTVAVFESIVPSLAL